MAVYSIDRYPRPACLRDDTSVVVRPMKKDDAPAVLAFFQRIPEEERFFLKHDVASPTTIEAFACDLDYDRALPLLAFAGDRVIGDAVLIRHRGGYRRHMASLRVVIDPEFRNRGLGVLLITELLDIAWDAELEHAEFEAIDGVQDEMMSAAKYVGAMEVGRIRDSVKDQHGQTHDLVILRVPLGKWWQWSRY